MDPAFTLKRSLEVDLKLCIFCQKHDKSKEILKVSTEYSRNVVRDATIKRQKLRDVANRDVSDRLDNLLGTNQEDSFYLFIFIYLFNFAINYHKDKYNYTT